MQDITNFDIPNVEYKRKFAELDEKYASIKNNENMSIEIAKIVSVIIPDPTSEYFSMAMKVMLRAFMTYTVREEKAEQTFSYLYYLIKVNAYNTDDFMKNIRNKYKDIGHLYDIAKYSIDKLYKEDEEYSIPRKILSYLYINTSLSYDTKFNMSESNDNNTIDSNTYKEKESCVFEDANEAYKSIIENIYHLRNIMVLGSGAQYIQINGESFSHYFQFMDGKGNIEKIKISSANLDDAHFQKLLLEAVRHIPNCKIYYDINEANRIVNEYQKALYSIFTGDKYREDLCRYTRLLNRNSKYNFSTWVFGEGINYVRTIENGVEYGGVVLKGEKHSYRKSYIAHPIFSITKSNPTFLCQLNEMVSSIYKPHSIPKENFAIDYMSLTWDMIYIDKTKKESPEELDWTDEILKNEPDLDNFEDESECLETTQDDAINQNMANQPKNHPKATLQDNEFPDFFSEVSELNNEDIKNLFSENFNNAKNETDNDLQEKDIKEENSEEKNDENNLNKIINPVKIKHFLDETVIGQENAKISLASALSNHLVSLKGIGKPLKDRMSLKQTTLLIGPSGSGKTMLAKRLGEYCSLPVIIVDSSQFTAEGWKGNSKIDIYKNLYKNYGREVGEFAIIVLDEFDKMCLNSVEYGPKDQASFLSVFDGTPIFDSKSIDEDEGKQYETANNLYILTGAFSGLFEKEKKGGIGFIKDTQMTEMNIREKLVDFGLMPELVGRITDIVFTEPLSEDEIYEAILCSKEVKQYYTLAEEYGKKLIVDEDFIRDMIRKRFSALGVRGVKSILDAEFRHALYHSFENDEDIVIGKKKQTCKNKERI